MEDTFTALRNKPCKETVQAFVENTVQIVKTQGCEGCAPKITEGMCDFVDLFARKVENAVSQVSCTLGFYDRS